MLLESFKDYLIINSIEVAEVGRRGESLRFRHNGLNYVFDTDENDPYYCRLLLPNVLRISEGIELKAFRAASEISESFKATKAFAVNNSIWISIDCLIYSETNINDLFDRLMRISEHAITKFRELTKEDE